MNPFLTIVTRCCHRPKMLAANIRSVMAQTDRSVEQVYIVDEKKQGLKLANKSLYDHRDRIRGEWVYILDDDTRLVLPTFVASLRKVAAKADVIMVKSSRPQLAPHVLPKPDVWSHPDRFRVSSTNCLCYVVRRELWQKHIYHFGRRAAGDWWFLKAIAGTKPRYAWLDLVVAETQQLGRARHFENCRADWWKRTVRQFGLEDSHGWRLPLWERAPAPKRKRKPRPKKRPAKVVKRKKPPTPAPVKRRKVTPVKRKEAKRPKRQHSDEAPAEAPVPVKPPAHVILGRRRVIP